MLLSLSKNFMKVFKIICVRKFFATTSAVLLSIFLNRGINLKPSSLGVFYQEVADSYPQIINNPVSHRPLLPFLSFLTGFDVQILNIVLLYIFTYLVYSVLRQKILSIYIFTIIDRNRYFYGFPIYDYLWCLSGYFDPAIFSYCNTKYR